MLSLISTLMGDHWQVGKPSQYVTSHPGQLSLAIPLSIVAMITSERWNISKRTLEHKQAHHTMHSPHICGLSV